MLILTILFFIGYSCVLSTPIIRNKEVIPEYYGNYSQDTDSILPNVDKKLKYFIANKLESISNALNDGKIIPPAIIRPNQGDRFQVLAVANSERFIRVRGNQTDGRITIMEGEILVGESPPLHIHHREDEYFHVLQGEIEFLIGNKKILGKTGTWIFAPKYIQHTFRNINSTGARLEYVFQPAGIEFYFEEVSQVIIQQKPNWQTQASAVANKYGIELVGTPNWNG